MARALRDPSRAIRGLAARLAPLCCSDEQLQEPLASAPISQRGSLLRHLLKRNRRAAIDAFLERLAATGDADLPRLLAYGSEACVRRHLAGVSELAAQEDWRRLARIHPRTAAESLIERARAATEVNFRLVWQANDTLATLAKRAPDRGVALVRQLVATISLAHLQLQALAQQRPAELAGLLLEHREPAHVSLGGVADRLDLGQVQALLERRLLDVQQLWLRRRTPAERRALYQRFGRGWRGAEGALEHWLVALLPAEERAAEGKRHLALPALAARPMQRLPYASFLAWDEARRALAPFAGDPDPEVRARALSALVYAVRFHREPLGALLVMLRARRNEQDPVRQALLSELAALPPGMWRAEHLEGLGQIIREALDAFDLSPATASQA